MKTTTLKTKEQIEAFICGVNTFYQSLNTIDYRKYVNFYVIENETYFKVKFFYVSETYTTKPGEDPSETPEDKIGECDFIWKKDDAKKDLMELVVSTLDQIDEFKIEEL